MPIYEYQCDACQHQLETIQKVSDEPLKICPSCGEPALRKLVSAAAFQLKGTGWYVTDFRDKGHQQKGGSGESAGNGKGNGDGGTSKAQGDASSKTGTGEGSG